MDQGTLDKKDRKLIVKRTPPSIRELLLRNEEIVEGIVTLDELLDNILSTMRDCETAFVISAFHTKLRADQRSHGSGRQAETEVTNAFSVFSPELLNLQASIADFEEKERKRSDARREKKPRR